MARTYLFLVHGVGRHPQADWAESWKRVLIEKLRRYAPYSSMSAADIEAKVLCFVPIGYDAIFEGYRLRWTNLDGVLGSSELVAQTAVGLALEWVRDQDPDLKAIFWEKVLDALLWATNAQARAAVISSVNEQLVEGLARMNRENQGKNSAHVLAHSLGTSVIHDSMIALRAAGGVHEGVLDADRFQWRSVFMVANTSRLLEPRFDVSDELDPGDFKVYASAMRPGSRSSLVAAYHNARHRLDPITWPRRFVPLDWPRGSFADVETVHFDQLERVHDLETYAANPYLHVPLFQTILGNSRLGKPDEIERALKDLDRDYPLVSDLEFQNLKSLIDLDPSRPISLRKLVEFLVQAYRELRP